MRPTRSLGRVGFALALGFVPVAATTTSATTEANFGTAHREEQEGGPEIVVPLLERLPVLDGVLDDDVWANAVRTDGFVQTEPEQGEPATFPTEVYVAHTRDALLIAARLHDDDPEAVVAREYRRDADLESDDRFVVVLDTYHDHRNMVFFATNAVGTRQDGLVQNQGDDVNDEWDGVWSAASRRADFGWATEMVIPFETLRFPTGAPAGFGVNFGREIARNREETWWAEIQNDWGFSARWRASAFGALLGLENADPGGRVKLKPFSTAGGTREDGRNDGNADVGLDGKIALGSNLNLDVTLNTDFAQVEADEQQVNLTRFELFFPEQRDFFLENAGLFQVGEFNRPFEPAESQLFFSRRIGLSEDGDIVPIFGGARLTGKLGATDVGAFHIRQQELDDVSPATGFSAFRLRRDVLARSQVGAMVIDRRETGGSAHTVAAADFSWAWSDYSTVSGFVARSSTPGLDGPRTAASLHAEVTNDRASAWGDYTYIGEDFRSEVGFVPRTGIRKLKLSGLWSPRPGALGIRQIFFGPGLIRITEPDGAVQSQNIGVGPYVLFEDGSNIFFNVGWNKEGLTESFELRDDVVIEAGEYRTSEYVAAFSSSGSRPVSAGAFLLRNGFFDGSLRIYSPSISIRPNPRVRLSVNYSRNEIRLPQPGGDFDTNLIVLRGFVALSPDAFVRGLLQWNDDDGNFSGNVQFRWNYRPGSDLYVVYNERRPFGAGSDVETRSELIAKLTFYWTPG